ncbi:MAG: gliding motility-associated C-terminal domain-containing protein, partial [Cyclobacteriaceae bacterium]
NPYEYSTDGTNWITFISGNEIENLPPNGNYNILIRQNEEFAYCNTTVAVSINGPDEIRLVTPAIIPIKDADCNINNGEVTIPEVTGGTAPYNYQLDGDFISMPADRIIGNLRAGAHTLGIVDDTGCTREYTFNVPSPGAVIASVEEIPVSCTSIQLKAGIRIVIDLDATDVSGPYRANIRALDPTNTTDIDVQMPDNGVRTFLELDKGTYEVFVSSASVTGCRSEAIIQLNEGPSPVDFDIIEIDSVVSCVGENGFITIGNVRGDVNTIFEVSLMNLSGVVLESYSLQYAELQNGFTIDGRTTDLGAGEYQIHILQNQTGCPNISKTSDPINIYEPLATLGFEVIDDAVSLIDIPTGNIRGEVQSSGGDPFFGLIQLKQPAVSLSINDVLNFNNNQKWRRIVNSSVNTTRFLVTFDTLWAGLYEIFITDSYGCEIVIEHFINYDERLFIPNVITPNNDGSNDVFFIRNLPPEGTELVIANRWGKTVFSTKNYNEENLWDGGEEADGIFFYKLKLPNGEKHNGWLEVWRGARP